MPRVDIHAHILPGLDNGPIALEESMAMARKAVRDGTTTIVATPNQQDMELESKGVGLVQNLIDFLNAILQSEIRHQNQSSAYILPGAINRLEPSLLDAVGLNKHITLNRTNFLLVDPPLNHCPPYIEEVIGRLLSQRLIPVIAHPERNIGFQRNPNRFADLANSGVIAQISAGSLTGLYGSDASNTAELFLRSGIAHVVASEMHSANGRLAPDLSTAFDIVVDMLDERRAVDLFETNPNMIISGRTQHGDPDSVAGVSGILKKVHTRSLVEMARSPKLARWRDKLKEFTRRRDREPTE